MMTQIAGGLHIAVNGWFAGETTAGTGQYTNHILRHLPGAGENVRITLLAPPHLHAGADLPPGVELVRLALPPLPENLAKLWFEQVSVPRAARRIGADVLWVPYWAAPWRQPLPTVVTIHDLIPLLLPLYRGGLLQRGYTWLCAQSRRSDRREPGQRRRHRRAPAHPAGAHPRDPPRAESGRRRAAAAR